jgi:hypothetical protein
VFDRRGVSAWSLMVIALTQAVFQAWCYNTGSHPALNPFQMWGIFPGNDSCLYYTAACELLNGQRITVLYGARHPFPLLLALLLKIFGHDFRSVTLVLTIVMALATWSAFEVIRCRLGSVAAPVFMACVTFYIRIHCTGLLMTEQLGLIYSLCGVGMLVESLAHEGKAKTWLYCGGLFFITQALNARPAAYMTLPFLVLASWELSKGNSKVKCRIVALSAVAVATSMLLHSITYYSVLASRVPSNAWFCIYGLLNNGTWRDGLNHTVELLRKEPGLAPANWQHGVLAYAQGLRMLREECLTEIRHHPGKLWEGWWRALRFLWSKNTPFCSAYPQMPALWFTEFLRWCAVLGLALSLFFLLRGGRLAPELKTYQTLSWLNLAALLGMIASLPVAPPWDGETRIFAATLPLFFLWPASGVGGLYLLIATRLRKVRLESKTESHPKIATRTAATIGATLSIMIISTAWYLVGTGSPSENRRHPVESVAYQLRIGGPSVTSFDLRSLQAGYRLRVTDDTQATWLPNISRANFVHNVPRGAYAPLSSMFKQLPPNAEIVALPYWVLLLLDEEDVRSQTFTPRLEQTGHVIWPPVYVSKHLHVPVP